MMGNKGDLKMEDIQIALKVLEAASGMSPPSSALPHPLPPSSSFIPPSLEREKEMLMNRQEGRR
jgi:hypothetical protein